MIAAFIARLIALLTSKDTQAQIVERITKNPRTSWLGLFLIMTFGAGASLDQAGFHLAGGLVIGFGFAIAALVLLFSKDAPPKDPPTP